MYCQFDNHLVLNTSVLKMAGAFQAWCDWQPQGKLPYSEHWAPSTCWLLYTEL